MNRSPAGDFDYEREGGDYERRRQADPRIEALVHAALGASERVINVGAGAGSYEPVDRYVAAVEPSASMRARRPPDRVPAIDAVAEALPFDDAAFDAAMAVVTVHQWRDPFKGLSELRRVTRGPVVVLTFDGDVLDEFWLAHYVPELIAAERLRYPSLPRICETLGEPAIVERVAVPIDCTDGFTEAFYPRPDAFLVEGVRRSQSAWGFVSTDVEKRAVAALARDIESGEWDQRFGHLRHQPSYEGSLRLVVSTPTPD